MSKSWSEQQFLSAEIAFAFPPFPSPFELCSVHSRFFPANLDIAGRFRRDREIATIGTVRQGVAPSYINMEIGWLTSFLRTLVNDPERKHDEIDILANYHHRLSTIHPFFDGNGRTVLAVTCMQLRDATKKTYASIIRKLLETESQYHESLVLDYRHRRLKHLNNYFRELVDYSYIPGDSLLTDSHSAWLWFDKQFADRG